MSLTEEFRQSRSKHQVAFVEFALLTNGHADYLFCFFEGKDNTYYTPRIKQYATERYRFIICNGRDSVLAVHQLIAHKTEYKDYKKAFFIDKDFNDPLPAQNPPIFETPCYSIENLYVSPVVFGEILVNAFYLHSISDTYKTCLNFFIQKQQDFHQAILLLNAWWACLINIRNTTGKKIEGVHLEEKPPKGFIEITLEKIEQKYDFDKIRQIFPDAPSIDGETLNAKIEAFQSNPEKHKLFRGKYELDFLLKVLQLLVDNDKKIANNKISFAFAGNLNNERALMAFSPYAETPESLIAYLKEVVK